MRRLVLLLCITGYVISQNLDANSTIFEKSLNETDGESKDNRNYTERLRDVLRTRGKTTPGNSEFPILYHILGLVTIIVAFVVLSVLIFLIFKCVRNLTRREDDVQRHGGVTAPSTAVTSGRPSVSGGAAPVDARELQDLTTIDEGNESRASTGYGPPAKENTRVTYYGTTGMTRSQSSAL